jgi:hypothetical protein
MIEFIFQKEDLKYSALWQNDYKDANWQRLAKVGIRLSKNLDGDKTLVDFGFGRGSAMKFFEDKGFKVSGVEISRYAVDECKKKGMDVYHSSLDALTIFEDDKFKIGFCNDVMEHIPDDSVIGSLDEMARVCSQYLLLSVCPTPSHHLSMEGENLHLTVRPAYWWERRFEKYGRVEKMNFFMSRSLRYVIELKK